MTDTTSAVLSMWMEVPSPNPLSGVPYFNGDRQPNPLPENTVLDPALAQTWSSLWVLTAVFAVLGIIWASVQAVRRNSAAGFVPALKMVLAVLAVTGFAVPALWLTIQFSDTYAIFIMSRASGTTPDGLLQKQLFVQEQFVKLGLVTSGLTAILVVFSNVAQMLFMLLRAGLLVVLIGVWPTVAAATGTETGMAAFKKLNAWILALVLYKPAAATIYALGLMLFNEPTTAGVRQESMLDTLMSVMSGVVVLLMACLALPALIKFMSPPAGIGASSAFSGGAAIGAVATGAVAVAGIAATGGAGAAATGAGRATQVQPTANPSGGPGGPAGPSGSGQQTVTSGPSGPRGPGGGPGSSGSSAGPSVGRPAGAGSEGSRGGGPGHGSEMSPVIPQQQPRGGDSVAPGGSPVPAPAGEPRPAGPQSRPAGGESPAPASPGGNRDWPGAAQVAAQAMQVVGDPGRAIENEEPR